MRIFLLRKRRLRRFHRGIATVIAREASAAHSFWCYLGQFLAVDDDCTAVEFSSIVEVEGFCHADLGDSDVDIAVIYIYRAVGVHSVNISRRHVDSGVAAVEFDYDIVSRTFARAVYAVIIGIDVYSSAVYLNIGGLRLMKWWMRVPFCIFYLS